MIKLAIFDLDGTLLNTIADLALSTNFALSKLGYETHAIEKFNMMVGNGIDKLFERALPEGQKSKENIAKMREIFVDYYAEHLTDESTPYDGIMELLQELKQRNIKLAIATNKYQAGTDVLVKHFFNDVPFLEVLGQRQGIPTKPDPHIIDEILERIPVRKEEVLYIGDSDVDMMTAQNAQVIGCGVSWGFRPVDELKAHKPQYIVDHPKDILNIIDNHS